MSTTRNGLARRQTAPTPVMGVIPIRERPSGAEGDPPEPDNAQTVLLWDEDDQAAANYRNLGRRLAQFDDLYRRPAYASGLLLLLGDGQFVMINKGRISHP
jgi:hypothetical protein